MTAAPLRRGAPAGPRPTLALVGTTGSVGTVARQVLSTRQEVWGEVRLVASARSVGRTVPLRGEEVAVRALTPEVFADVDVAVFDTPAAVTSTWAPVAVQRGATVVDASGAFAGADDVPLVLPEINAPAARNRPRGIVATPGDVTLPVALVVGVLHAELGLLGLNVATYQAASGVGRSGVDALHDQVSTVAGDRSLGSTPGDVRRVVGPDTDPFPAPLAFNVVPWSGDLADDGDTSDEVRVRRETRRLLDLPDLPVSATCVRVPVVSGHSAVVHATFDAPADAGRAREILRDAPGVVLYDDPTRLEWPTPADVVGTDPVWVGRVRRPREEPHALDLFLSVDNLRKGAALNTVQVAELVLPTGS